MASLRIPSPSPVPGANERSLHMPLSSHGLPKAPRTLSPHRPHRFSTIAPPALKLHPKSATSSFAGLLTPPMSATSATTHIDSAPSTPAWSPRSMDDTWDSKSALLRPMSSCSAPSSPREPKWDMIEPSNDPKNTVPDIESPGIDVSASEALRSHPVDESAPVNQSTPATPRKDSTLEVPSWLGTIPPSNKNKDEEIKQKIHEDPVTIANSAPLGKLATRMRSILGRRNTSNKKSKKKPRAHEEVERLEDADKHWSEM
jgi:pyruvate dehydrogenase phosphatase